MYSGQGRVISTQCVYNPRSHLQTGKELKENDRCLIQSIEQFERVHEEIKEDPRSNKFFYHCQPDVSPFQPDSKGRSWRGIFTRSNAGSQESFQDFGLEGIHARNPTQKL